MARIAATAKADFSILVTQEDFIESYYARKYDLAGKSFRYLDNTADEAVFMPYLNECSGDKPNVTRFVVIRKITAEERPLNNIYFIGKREFKLAITDLYRYDYFPYRPLQALIRHPLVLEIDTFQLKGLL